MRQLQRAIWLAQGRQCGAAGEAGARLRRLILSAATEFMGGRDKPGHDGAD